jgi:hypothetical protein
LNKTDPHTSPPGCLSAPPKFSSSRRPASQPFSFHDT